MTEEQPVHEIGWPELAELVFAAKGIKSGLWRLGVKIRFAAMGMEFMEREGNAGSITALPAAISAIESIVVFPADKVGPMVFDASTRKPSLLAGTSPATTPRAAAKKTPARKKS